jgi:predicted RNA binding protein YcfA (HicA-like mRNA interferase family)
MMARLTPTDWKTQIKIFETYGCKYKRKKGSHHVLIYADAKRAVVIPEYAEVDLDIIKNNMRTVGMSREDYFRLLDEV